MRWLAALLWLTASAGAGEFTTLKGHGGPVMAIAVAPDGQVVTGSFDNSVGLWDGRDPTWLEGHDAAVSAVAVMGQGAVISGGDDFAIRLWPEGRVLGTHRGKVAAVAVRPGHDQVASGSWDGTIMLWPLDGADGQALPDPGAGVNVLHFSPDGAMLFAGTADGRVLRYDMGGGAPVPLVRNGFGVNTLAVTTKWLAYGAVDGGTRVIGLPDGTPMADFTLDRRPILAMAHHAGTQQLAVGDGDGFIMVLDTATWNVAHDVRATRKGPVWALAFAPDGATLYAGGLDSAVSVWPMDALQAVSPADTAAEFLRTPGTMPNGERQFMRKCSICHALDPGPSRKAGPTLHGVFGRPAGQVAGYGYSPTLRDSDIIWSEDSINALFDQGPDRYIPGSKMPMQVIAGAGDRADLIAFLRQATGG